MPEMPRRQCHLSDHQLVTWQVNRTSNREQHTNSDGRQHRDRIPDRVGAKQSHRVAFLKAIILNQRGRKIRRGVFHFVVANSLGSGGIDEGTQLGRVLATQRRVVRVEEKVPDGEVRRNCRSWSVTRSVCGFPGKSILSRRGRVDEKIIVGIQRALDVSAERCENGDVEIKTIDIAEAGIWSQLNN